jgi:acetylornithine/N-succinyldiaminopimelate aminotransferase
MFPALMPTYARENLAFERGEGAWLITADQRRFLDFGAGIATSSLGHGHPHLTQAIAEQAARVMHVSNLYRIPGAERLAQRLVDATFADSVFFCNSGAEANEGMVKMLRRAMAQTGRPERWRTICFEGAFHGRTLAMLSATGNAKYLNGFGPQVDGFDQVPFGNMNALRDAITAETAAVLVEPVQGEGGVRVAPAGFLRDLRAACDEFGIFLALDEVQCGMGRTGKLFACEWAAVSPDIMTVAKALGGGFPIGACLATTEAAKGMTFGTHGSTYGGNPLGCAVGLAAFDEIVKPEMLEHVRELGGYFGQQLQGLKDRYPDVIAEIRGKGLLIGLKMIPNNRAFMQHARDAQLLIAGGGENCVRLLPPLVMTVDEAREVIERLEMACKAAQGKAA